MVEKFWNFEKNCEKFKYFKDSENLHSVLITLNFRKKLFLMALFALFMLFLAVISFFNSLENLTSFYFTI